MCKFYLIGMLLVWFIVCLMGYCCGVGCWCDYCCGGWVDVYCLLLITLVLM